MGGLKMDLERSVCRNTCTRHTTPNTTPPSPYTPINGGPLSLKPLASLPYGGKCAIMGEEGCGVRAANELRGWTIPVSFYFACSGKHAY